MKRKKEIKYLNKHWKMLQDNFKSFVTGGGTEQLHELRVEVKKLKAVLMLMQSSTDSEHLLKHFKPVQRIFKHAGEIRDAQIHLQLAERYHLHDQSFEQDERNKMDVATGLFIDKASKYLRSIKRTHSTIKSRLRHIPDKSIARFYKSELKLIAQSLTIPHFDERLHDCRKKIKVLMYNRNLVSNALHKRVVFNEEYADDVQSKIGDWHDYVLATALFDSTNAQTNITSSKLKRESRILEKAITDTSQNFIIKVSEKAAASDKQLSI